MTARWWLAFGLGLVVALCVVALAGGYAAQHDPPTTTTTTTLCAAREAGCS